MCCGQKTNGKCSAFVVTSPPVRLSFLKHLWQHELLKFRDLNTVMHVFALLSIKILSLHYHALSIITDAWSPTSYIQRKQCICAQERLLQPLWKPSVSKRLLFTFRLSSYFIHAGSCLHIRFEVNCYYINI